MITEGEFWYLVNTGRENFKKTRVTDDIITRDKNEYYSHTLAEVVDEKKEQLGLDHKIQDW